MCGIVGYLGERNAVPVIINGLKRLEYRGYDSAGISIMTESGMKMAKCKGKVADLENKINGSFDEGKMGIGHTRWATHGVPNDINAHPHTSNSGDLILIHNGIIENYSSIKEALTTRGFSFESDTD
ncbi:MAG: glutamine--fructose-6-phosphate aminotransferase, partial [Owenweeksia sp.]